jgi:hypothetical protein
MALIGIRDQVSDLRAWLDIASLYSPSPRSRGQRNQQGRLEMHCDVEDTRCEVTIWGVSTLRGVGGPLLVTILADLRQDVVQLWYKSSSCLGSFVFGGVSRGMLRVELSLLS